MFYISKRDEDGSHYLSHRGLSQTEWNFTDEMEPFLTGPYSYGYRWESAFNPFDPDNAPMYFHTRAYAEYIAREINAKMPGIGYSTGPAVVYEK